MISWLSSVMPISMYRLSGSAIQFVFCQYIYIYIYFSYQLNIIWMFGVHTALHVVCKKKSLRGG